MHVACDLSPLCMSFSFLFCLLNAFLICFISCSFHQRPNSFHISGCCIILWIAPSFPMHSGEYTASPKLILYLAVLRRLLPYTLRKKVLQSTFFWCFMLSQIGGPFQYLEGPNSTWKDHDGNLGVLLDPKIPIMVLPGTILSFQVLNRVLYLWQSEAPKKVLWSTFFLRV